MRYVLMIYQQPEEFKARTGQSAESFWGAWRAYAQAIERAGIMVGGTGLEPPEAATTLRLSSSGGGAAIQDGPYADTKEQLGGFFVIDVPDLDSALDWAARAPVLRGAVEVRPALGGRLTEPAS